MCNFPTWIFSCQYFNGGYGVLGLQKHQHRWRNDACCAISYQKPELYHKTVTQYSQPSSRLRLSSVMMSMIKMHIRDINAVCDFILEASDWAASLALLPEEQRGDRPLFGLPVIFIIENMIIVVGISCRSWLKTVRLGVSNQLTSRKNITLSISSPGFCEGVFSRERLRRHHWSCPGSSPIESSKHLSPVHWPACIRRLSFCCEFEGAGSDSILSDQCAPDHGEYCHLTTMMMIIMH